MIAAPADVPVVPTVAANRVAKDSPTDARPTFEAACNAVLEHSWLRAIIDGSHPAATWAEALTHDAAAAHRLIDDFAADLALITGRRVLRTRTLNLPLAENLQGWPDAKHAARLWESFQWRFQRLVSASVAEVQYSPSCSGSGWNDAAIRFPADPIVWTNPGTCTFSWPEAMYTRIWVSLGDVVYRDALDYTGFLPRRARRKLHALAHTRFDYRPVVVEGTLVEERVDDPALALRLGEGFADLVVDYWRVTRREQRQLWWKTHDTLCVVFVLAALFLLVGTPILFFGTWMWGSSITSKIVATLVALFGLLTACCGTVVLGFVVWVWRVERRPLRL